MNEWMIMPCTYNTESRLHINFKIEIRCIKPNCSLQCIWFFCGIRDTSHYQIENDTMPFYTIVHFGCTLVWPCFPFPSECCAGLLKTEAFIQAAVKLAINCCAYLFVPDILSICRPETPYTLPNCYYTVLVDFIALSPPGVTIIIHSKRLLWIFTEKIISFGLSYIF